MRLDDGRRLAYCTNIHAARGVAAIEQALATHAAPLRARLSPHGPLGVGLRLSDAESRELDAPGALDALRARLDALGLEVFTLNGFVHGHFHGQPVKAAVHEPDWRAPARAAYTLRLARILAALLPPGDEGTISTSPLAYRTALRDDDHAGWRAAIAHLVEVCAGLVRLADETGRTVRLCIEPEPDGRLETGAELVDFFEQRLLGEGAARLAATLGSSRCAAETHLREHLGLCLDACHAAVAFEEPGELLARVDAAGLRIAKVQISSALRVEMPPDPAARAALGQRLRAFVEPIYLHQVVARCDDGSLRRFPDLEPALEALERPEWREWRIHFHVPVFCARFGELDSTRPMLAGLLRALDGRQDCRHLEIETYTWDVLPPGLDCSLTDALAREFAWVLETLASAA